MEEMRVKTIMLLYERYDNGRNTKETVDEIKILLNEPINTFLGFQ